uniref:Uncharacterized protein n=1 Tax=Oncorhynchus tshawytscha TaxID=74940 RepID=A0A8C8LQJ4_ONCTS
GSPCFTLFPSSDMMRPLCAVSGSRVTSTAYLISCSRSLMSPSACLSAAFCFSSITSMSSVWLLSMERTRAVKTCTLSDISLSASF